VDETWTLPELVAKASDHVRALPPPKNGQVRAVPDERTIRYYAALGLLDRPSAMRGRTALYGRRHLAQVVAIKRMQSAGKSLAEIQALWPSLEDKTLSRMSGVHVGESKPGGAALQAGRKEFWKQEAEPRRSHPMTKSLMQTPKPTSVTTGPGAPVILPVPTFTPYPTAPGAPATSTTTITIPLEGNASIAIALRDDAGVLLSAADIRALRVAAAPLVAELAKRGLIADSSDTLEEP
jgi:DNA-binding transcriptional MerR regulator